jgi:HAD superfamily hydrolase (TIGR01509 family)
MTARRLRDLILRKRLLIFDFDGTIADSSPLHARAFNEAFATHDVAVDYGTIAGLTTGAAVDLVADVHGLTLTPAARALLISDKQARARRMIASELVPIAGSVEFMREARPRYLMALCTSASRATIELAIARLALEGMFDPIVTGDDVVHGKPHPETFLRALAHHGLPASDALVLEDAESGLAAARAAGIDMLKIVAGPASDPSEANWSDLSAALGSVAA